MANWLGGNGDWSSTGTNPGWGTTPPGTNSDSYYTAVIDNGATVTVSTSDSYTSGFPNLMVGDTQFDLGTQSGTLIVSGTLTGINTAEVGANGTITVNAGGTFGDSQSLLVDSGGTFNAYGTVNVSSGITVSGVFTVYNGATVTDGSGLTVNAGSSVNIYGTFYPGSTGLTGNGTVTVNGGTLGTAAAALDMAGTNNVIVENGATVYINNQNPPGSITFGGGTGNKIVFTNYISTLTTPITGFAPGDTIQFNNTSNAGTGGTTLTSNGNGTYTVNVTGSNVVLSDVTLAPGVTPAQVSAQPGSGGYDIGGCFLTGTLISTPAGELAVESLQVGDTVTTSQSGSLISKKIKWIGFRSIKPGELTGDEAHPVRVKADAFADSIPARDLLITGEHCILVDGGLIPVRMLVNGRSIITDTSISSFTYYHVELEEHSILLAEGVEVESYLDTGNRGDFANAPVAHLRPQFRLHIPAINDASPVVPLTVDPSAVKPIWDRLNDRAISQGLVQLQPEVSLTENAEIKLITSTGDVILPLSYTGGKAIFALPAHAAGLVLASRTARPCDIVGRYVDDRRELGLSVGAITLKTDVQDITVDTHLSDETLTGWYRPEGPGYRWTNGMASLPSAISTNGEAATLEIEILRAGPYLALVSEESAIAA